MALLARYGAVLRHPGARAAFTTSLLGRVSLGMTGLATLLLVRQSTGSYAWAGAIAGLYALAFAAGAPGRARSADRRGPVRVLLRCSVVHPLALGLLVVLAERHTAPVLLALPAMAAGLSVPPLGAVMRALWASWLGEQELTTAYSMEAVAVELCFIIGPALTAFLVAATGPSAAVLTGAALVLLGGPGLALSAGARGMRPHPDRVGSLAGPLVSPAVRALLLTVFWIGVAFGAVEATMPAFAHQHGSTTATAGVLLAVWSVGSMAGGLVYGGLTLRRPHREQLPWLVGALSLGTVLPLLAGGPLAMGIALLLYGTAIAPFSTVNSVLLGAAAPTGTTTEAFAWNGSMIFGGAALGTATAGWLVEHVSTTAALAVVPVAGGLTLASSLWGLHRIAAPPTVVGLMQD